MRRGTATAVARAAAVFVCSAAFAFPALNVFAGQQEQSKEHAVKRPEEIVLPPLLETEKPATLAVLDNDGALAVGVKVALSTGQTVTTDSTGRARFVVTSAPGPFQAEISGSDVRASSVVLSPQENPTGGIVVADYPYVAVLQDHIAIRGVGFRGDADVNFATLNGQQVFVMASSPVSLVLMPGPTARTGPTDLLLQVGGEKTKPMSVTLISLVIERPQGKLTVGMRSKLTVHVLGTGQKLTLAVRNTSTASIELTGGNLQRLTTSGGTHNKVDVPIKTLQAGDFSVSVRLVRPASGAPDLGLVHRELLAARALATGAWVGMVDQAIERLDGLDPLQRDAHGISLLLQELAEMFSADPSAEMAKHLQAAWAALLQS
jgi:hypothetical protein